MKTPFFFSLFLLTLGCQGQITHSIDAFGYPLNQKLGNLEKQYISIGHELIDVQYQRTNPIEFGISYRQTFPNGLSWNIGHSVLLAKHRIFYRIFYSTLDPVASTIDEIDRTIMVNSFSFKIGLAYNFKKRFRTALNLIAYFPHWVASDGPSKIETVSASTSGGWNIYEKIYELNHLDEPVIVPQFVFSVELLKGLHINTGFRLKFWSINDYFRIDVTGYFNNE